jgi:hypothetical protein
MADWQAWHDEYDDPDSRLSKRLAIVQGYLRRALDRRPPGPIQLLSLCAGQGRDVIGVLMDHPRAGDVDAVLIEADVVNAEYARETAELAVRAGSITVVQGDASSTDAMVGAVPADVLLLCGIFGNISDEDVEHTVRNCSRLCADDASVLWTRHPKPPDLTVSIRSWFAQSGFVEDAFEAPEDLRFGVGMHRLIAEPEHFYVGLRLFQFLR